MDQALTTGQADDLERLIDRHGIENVLRVISMICGLKADHLQTMWQDHSTARFWSNVAKATDTAANKARGL